jgi:S-DNA-T family DNA segregation ATPase FtsK/SpoIIIE
MSVLTEAILAEAIRDKTDSSMILPLYVGRTCCNEKIFIDLALQPHLLLGGDSGSGKTNCLNVIICGLASRFTPSQLQLVLIDTAIVEFYDYAKLPHLAFPVLNKIEDCAEALRWLSTELDKRLVEIIHAGHRNIQAYNAAGGTMPYIVVIIDRLNDLTCADTSDIVSNLKRLTALARPVGIHFVAATDCAEYSAAPHWLMPGRIAFRTRHWADSVFWIRDTQACELQNSSDMLILRPNGTFISAHCDYLFDEDQSQIIGKLIGKPHSILCTSQASR